MEPNRSCGQHSNAIDVTTCQSIIDRAKNASKDELNLVLRFRSEHFAPAIFNDAMEHTGYGRRICRSILQGFCSNVAGFDSYAAAAALEIGMMALSIHSMLHRGAAQASGIEVGVLVLAGDVCLMKSVGLALDSGLMRASAALAHLLSSHSQARVLETPVAGASLNPDEAEALYLRNLYVALVEAALIAAGTNPRQEAMQALCAELGDHLAEQDPALPMFAAARGGSRAERADTSIRLHA